MFAYVLVIDIKEMTGRRDLTLQYVVFNLKRRPREAQHTMHSLSLKKATVPREVQQTCMVSIEGKRRGHMTEREFLEKHNK